MEPPKKTKVSILFYVYWHINFGDSVYICGSVPELGNWQPGNSVKLKWHNGDLWKVTIDIDASDENLHIEYKFIV